VKGLYVRATQRLYADEKSTEQGETKENRTGRQGKGKWKGRIKERCCYFV